MARNPLLYVVGPCRELS